MTLRLLLLHAATFLALTAAAQTRRELIDSVLTEKYYHTRTDTGYIARPEGRWSIKVSAKTSNDVIKTADHADGLLRKTRQQRRENGTLSLTAAYRGLSAALSLNPGRLTGRNSDTELNLNLYRNTFGGEVTMQWAKSFSGYSKAGGTKERIAAGTLNYKNFGMNAYYVFNHRHFSYPAAFSQTYIQKRSAGSLLAGASVQMQRFSAAGDDELGTVPLSLLMVNTGVGLGYGYNYVCRGLLLHASLLPTFVVASHTRLDVDGTRGHLHYRFPELISTARVAIVYNWRRYFIGASTIYTYSTMSSADFLRVETSKWYNKLSVGIRI